MKKLTNVVYLCFHAWLVGMLGLRVALASLRRPGPGSDVGRTDRGDVPGWVLITVMSAGLVAALWVLAEDQLKALFTDAVNSVTAGP